MCWTGHQMLPVLFSPLSYFELAVRAYQRLVQGLVYSSYFLVPEAWALRQLAGRRVAHSFQRSKIGCKGEHVGLVDGPDHSKAVLKFSDIVVINLEGPKSGEKSGRRKVTSTCSLTRFGVWASLCRGGQ